MELQPLIPNFYRVKNRQKLSDIAAAFSVPVCRLARENALTEEPCAGQVLFIPQNCGNLYCPRGGESRTLLCGSEENFLSRNGTSALFPAQRVYV